MIDLGYKQHYRAVHFTFDFGKHNKNGRASYFNALYRNRMEDTGFVHFYDDSIVSNNASFYPGDSDILAVPYREQHIIDNLSFDIAVIHDHPSEYAGREAALVGKKLIYVIHSTLETGFFKADDHFGLGQKEFESICELADAVVCMSEAEYKKLRSLSPRFSHKVHVIPGGKSIATQENTKKTLSSNKNIFGFMGDVSENDGLLECIRAFRQIDGELRISCKFSDGKYLNTLLDYIDMAELKDRIHFFGRCEGERTKKFLRSLDALIIPSFYDPFSYKVLDSLEEMVPVICRYSSSIPEIVGEYKYTYAPYEQGALANCIHTFLSDSENEILYETKKLFDRVSVFSGKNMSVRYNELFSLLNS